MAKGRTAFEIFKSRFFGKKEIPVEQQFQNPLEGRIGGSVRFVHHLDYENELWLVRAIWSWDRHINGTIQNMTDYHLVSDDKKLILRVLPKSDQIAILLMTQYWPIDVEQSPWADQNNVNSSAQILDALEDPTGEFVRFMDTPEEEKYFRDYRNILASVSVLSDKDQDGKVEMSEVEKSEYSLWTFYRQIPDEAGINFEQHLHVQVSGQYDSEKKHIFGGDKTIQMLRGEEITTRQIVIY